MAISLTHPFVSGKSDGGDATLVQPSNWNANHTIEMATARILGRTTAATGAVEELTAAQVSGLLKLPVRIWKTSIETINTDTTLSADSALVVTLGAGTWHVAVEAHWTQANAAMDFKWDTAFTGTATLTSMKHHHTVAGSAGTDIDTTKMAAFGDPRSATTTTAGTQNGWCRVVAIVVVTVSGDFQFQWAQNTSDGANLSVNAGSFLEYYQVA